MKYRLFRVIACTVLFMALTAAYSRAASYAPDQLNITGTWHGTFYYDDTARKGESGTFTVTMVQDGSKVSGGITEPNTFGPANLTTLTSTFSGTFDPDSGQINFTKTYDYDHHEVSYRGMFESSGREAAGRWHIGDYAGTWGMRR